MREILGAPRVVAVVGMSPKRDRPSNYVARYLRDCGFTIIAVNPTVGEVEGQKAYPDLQSIPKGSGIELVELFVAPERTMPVVEQAAAIGAKIVWFQPGAEHAASEERARELGLEVVSGLCVKAEHERLFAAPPLPTVP
jgi:predicted CoA-binding protein